MKRAFVRYPDPISATMRSFLEQRAHEVHIYTCMVMRNVPLLGTDINIQQLSLFHHLKTNAHEGRPQVEGYRVGTTFLEGPMPCGVQ